MFLATGTILKKKKKEKRKTNGTVVYLLRSLYYNLIHVSQQLMFISVEIRILPFNAQLGVLKLPPRSLSFSLSLSRVNAAKLNFHFFPPRYSFPEVSEEERERENATREELRNTAKSTNLNVARPENSG